MRSVAAIPAPAGSAYDHVRALLNERCLILDGRAGLIQDRSRALLEKPEQIEALHRRYVEAGADVIAATGWEPTPGAPGHWMERARRGVRLARQAAGPGTAVALSIDACALGRDGSETIGLVSRALAAAPPDLVIVESLTVLRPSLFATVEALLAAELPVWLSFRRCRHGLCGMYGQHWGGPEGDAFGRAARRFEQLGVGALLVNGIPPDHVDGPVAYLKEFTALPLGVHPNLGYRTGSGWRHEEGTTPRDFARQALKWRAEGAQIVGGDSGVT